MKSQNLNLRKAAVSIFATLPLMWGIGCAKKGDGFSADTPAAETPATPTNNPPAVTPRDTDGPRGSAFSAGATAELDGTTMQILTNYVGNAHPLNAPTDLKISVKLQEVTYNQWAGDVYISYLDNNQYYTAHFEAKDEKNPSSGTLYENYNHAFFNNWYSEPTSGKPVFHGFFEDNLGAVMLVVDNMADQGDGAGASEVSGSIWFKNYPATQVQKNPQGIPCWFITAGPYDCRTLLTPGWDGDGILSPTSALTPNLSQFATSKSTHPFHEEDVRRGWRKLGTFSGLNKAKAFTSMVAETEE